MGRDKAVLEWADGETFLARAIAALAPVVDEVLLATGPTPRYAEFGLRVVLDREGDIGPLAGLEAALRAALHEHVIVIAVDMPAVGTRVLRTLVERAEHDDLDVLLLASAKGPEPLCGAYHRRFLTCVERALDLGERRVIAPFSHPLADGRLPRLATLDVAELAEGEPTLNVNTLADLERARAFFDVEVRS